MLRDLWDLDKAGSTLIAALNQLKAYNPLDYCKNALQFDLRVLNKKDFSYEMIKAYVMNTW